MRLTSRVAIEVIMSEDIYQTNDEYKLSEKDLLASRERIRVSFEGKVKEIEVREKER